MTRQKKALNSILDFPKATLCKQIWIDVDSSNPKLNPKFRLIVLKKASKETANRNLKMVGCHFYGGSASYQYNDKSDVDIDIFVKWRQGTSEAEAKELQDEFKNIEIMHGSHPIHFYLKTPEESNRPEVAESVYDVLNDKWILPPLQLPENFDPDEYFKDMIEVAKLEANFLDVLIASLRRECELLISAKKALELGRDKSMIQHRIVYQKDRVSILLKKIAAKYDEYKKARQDMHIELAEKAKKAELDRFARFKQPEITWKYLEKYGYVNKMYGLKNLDK